MKIKLNINCDIVDFLDQKLTINDLTIGSDIIGTIHVDCIKYYNNKIFVDFVMCKAIVCAKHFICDKYMFIDDELDIDSEINAYIN